MRTLFVLVLFLLQLSSVRLDVLFCIRRVVFLYEVLEVVLVCVQVAMSVQIIDGEVVQHEKGRYTQQLMAVYSRRGVPLNSGRLAIAFFIISASGFQDPTSSARDFAFWLVLS